MSENSVSVNSINPTSCGLDDGEITISGLSNTESYVITYTLDSLEPSVTLTSNATGALIIEDLTSGNYTNITIEEISSGCIIGFEIILLDCDTNSQSCFTITPNGDQINDFWFLKPLNQNDICNYELLILIDMESC